jgi:radical SAM superfamily enzyme YgiQ (UPF0313 family)
MEIRSASIRNDFALAHWLFAFQGGRMRLLLIAPRSNAHTEYSGLSAPGNDASVTRIAAASIATVAALAPEDFRVSLCDEAVRAVDFAAEADVVGISANVSQALRAIEIAQAFRQRGKVVVMGGPHVSLAPELFEGRADCVVAGELEPIAQTVFADMRRGALKPRYDGSKADLRRSPMPRWDLYPNDRAVGGVVQTSRGCPFECHFCDVIQYLGRVQRHKDDAQVIAEIQNLYDHGYSFISLADDNFTVYRKRAKSLLKAIAAWNGAAGRDWVIFATQMSIDAARDEELLELCNEAGLLNAFVGLETSDEASLAESKKRQNMRVDLGAEIGKIVSRGLRVEAALMVGFDHDDRTVFARQLEFAMSLPVGGFNVSVLVAPVATPLYEAMRAQGRIVSDEVLAQFPSANLITNFTPARMSRDELYVGAKWLISKLMHPDNFSLRLQAMSELLAPPPWERHGRGRRLPARPKAAALFTQVTRDLTRRDERVAALVQRAFALMRKRPEIRDGISDALSNYLMTLRSYEVNGVYDRAWAGMDTPPFGEASSDARLERIRAYA